MSKEKVISLAELKLKKAKKNQNPLSLLEEAELYSQKFSNEFKQNKQKETKK
jgi:hypothetical protein